jgi:hypothetical protein
MRAYEMQNSVIVMKTKVSSTSKDRSRHIVYDVWEDDKGNTFISLKQAKQHHETTKCKIVNL